MRASRFFSALACFRLRIRDFIVFLSICIVVFQVSLYLSNHFSVGCVIDNDEVEFALNVHVSLCCIWT